MNRAIRVTASALGVSAGIAGLEHGYFELLQGSTQPDGLFVASIGPPCNPEWVWNRCEPALTIIPDFYVAGILAIIFGLITIIWSAFFIQRKRGGLVLILLSVGLLLFGGGLFPPLIGIIAGLTGTQINRPLTWTRAHFPNGLSRWLAKLHPWALAAHLLLVFGQFIIGYFFNEFLMANMGSNILILLSVGLLLYGGGLFPPLIGITAGLAGTRINKALTWTPAHFRSGLSRRLAKLYPWALASYSRS